MTISWELMSRNHSHINANKNNTYTRITSSHLTVSSGAMKIWLRSSKSAPSGDENPIGQQYNMQGQITYKATQNNMCVLGQLARTFLCNLSKNKHNI